VSDLLGESGSGGFSVGVNLPWRTYGNDFGRSATHPEGGLSAMDRPLPLEDVFARLAACDCRWVRWFVFCDGRSGIRWSEDGAPLGVDEAFFDDVDLAVDLTARHGLKLVPVLVDFLWFHPARRRNNVQEGGRAEVVANEAQRGALLANVVEPILDRYGRSPAIHSWDVINEPEWATRGVGAWLEDGGVWPAEMRAFIGAVVERVHAQTDHLVTVGSATARWRGLVSDLGLDYYQFHWYDHIEAEAPLERPVATMGLDRPAILGEFPTRGSARSAVEILEAARLAGYAGALAWSALSDDEASDFFGCADEIVAWRAEESPGGDVAETTA